MPQEDNIRQQDPKPYRQYWKAHITSWQASRLSQAEYCRRHELKFHQFVYWRRKFIAKPAAPISLVQVPMAAVARATGYYAQPAALRVALAPDLCIEVSPGFDPPTLQQGGDGAAGDPMIVPQHLRVFLALSATDMRKSINGLCLLVQMHMEMDRFAGHLFAFCNRRRTMVKILYWDRSGFCLWQKRLERHRLVWPESQAQVLRLDGRELHWLLEGLDIRQYRSHEALHYSLTG